MIIFAPNPVLSKRAERVNKIDKKVISIIEKMKNALLKADKPKGVGLAAPQIGIPLCIFISKPTPSTEIRIFINPEIIYYSKELSEIEREGNDKSIKSDKKLEGCLSIPNVWGNLKRSKSVKLRYMNEKGGTKEEEFDGFMATIVQHETDHINGILFTQRVLEQKQKLYTIEKDEDRKEKLMEIEL